MKTVTVFDVLKERVAMHAAYNSAEREHASTCQEGTRERVTERYSPPFVTQPRDMQTTPKFVVFEGSFISFK